MTTAQATDVAERFLEALSHRDFDALAATFAENGRLRGLVPPGLREADGREAIAERFGIWNDDIGDFAMLDSEITEMEDLTRIRWRVRGIDPDEGLTVYEQTAYASVRPDGIAWMNLVCTGRRPVQA